MRKFKIALTILVLATIGMTIFTAYALATTANGTWIPEENPEIWVTPALPEAITQIAPIPVGWAGVSLAWIGVGAVAVHRRKRKTL